MFGNSSGYWSIGLSRFKSVNSNMWKTEIRKWTNTSNDSFKRIVERSGRGFCGRVWSCSVIPWLSTHYHNQNNGELLQINLKLTIQFFVR